MKVSTIALVVGALFCANGAFAAATVSPSPNVSPKANKVLNEVGTEAAAKNAAKQMKKHSKADRLSGNFDDKKAKEAINAHKKATEALKKSSPAQGA